MSPEDTERLDAAINLIGRTGAADLEIGYLDDDVPVSQARWWAKARYGGEIVTAEDQPSPDAAAEALAKRLLTGGKCVHCMRTVSVEEGDGCVWRREGSRWLRGCEEEHPEGETVPTKRKLATALMRAGAPSAMVEAALAGYYHDFESELAFPEMQLVADLRKLGLEELAQRVIDGEFDASKEESEAWAKSPDGQAAFAELLNRPTGGNRAQRRANRRRHR